MVFYKIVQVQLSQNNVHELEIQEWHFILVYLLKMLTDDSYNDHNRKKADTKDSTTQKKRFYAMKMILRPGTPKISTIEKKIPKAW